MSFKVQKENRNGKKGANFDARDKNRAEVSHLFILF